MHRSLYPLCLAGLLAILAFVSCSRDASVPISPVIRGTDAGPARGIGVSQEPLAIADDSLPPGSVGADYTAFLTSSGGEGIPHLFKLDGDLPRGLRMDRFFGAMSTVIHGVPTEAGSSVFTVQVKDQAKNTATKTLTITIGPPTPVEITNLSPDLKKGTVGQPYSANLFAIGGVQSYGWEIITGALPLGLSLDSNVIGGTPASAGRFTFTAKVTDQAGQQDTKQFRIVVN